MNSSSIPSEWSRQYGNAKEYEWRPSTIKGRTVFQRPIGLVEYAFDTDGRHFEGRADMNCLLQLAIKSTLSKSDFRERILLAWTRLRCQHLLLQAKSIVIDSPDGECSFAPQGLHFVINVPENVEEAREVGRKHLVFLEDFYEVVDPDEFYAHCQNGTRVVDDAVALAKVFVLPLVEEDGEMVLRMLFVGAHMIWDGLSSYVWMRDFISCLNESPDTLRKQIAGYIKPASIQRRAPLPQEALYPPIHPGNKARQRWFWAITRILRHCRKQLPVGFANPLRRTTPKEALSLSPIYDTVLNYAKTPPLNTMAVHFRIPAQRLHRLCKQANASIGAGIFALVALTMMEFHEKLEPNVKPADRKSFITGFPLNPRAFFDHNNDPDSMMLAFSDGISLPFLPSHLPLEGRLRLLSRQAHRQLASYQKRQQRSSGDDAKQQQLQYLQSRGAGLVLANQYLYSLERVGTLREALNVQGEYPAKQNPTMQTCGVSSVGLRDRLIRRGMFNVEKEEEHDDDDDDDDDKGGNGLVVDFRDLIANVRAREGEFLAGAGGSEGEIFFAVSADVSSLDVGRVEEWRERMMHVLDEGVEVAKL